MCKKIVINNSIEITNKEEFKEFFGNYPINTSSSTFKCLCDCSFSSEFKTYGYEIEKRCWGNYFIKKIDI